MTRFATAAWTLLAISLLAAVILVRQAEAATTPSQAPIASAAEDEEEFELGEESEGEEEEFEEEEGEEFGTEGPLVLPADCLLRSAEAQVVASAGHDLVSLKIRYTASIPTKVSVDYWLKGGKGSLQLDKATGHFAQQGAYQVSERLSDRAMAKVQAARTFVVQLDIPAAPAYCARYSTQRLTVKHVVSNRATWSRAD